MDSQMMWVTEGHEVFEGFVAEVFVSNVMELVMFIVANQAMLRFFAELVFKTF